MAKIYIGFSAPKKCMIGAELIKIAQNYAAYSHVYIRFEASLKMPSVVYHAANGMVHFRKFDNFKTGNNIVKEYEIEIDESVKTAILHDCITLSGEGYGYLELLKIAFSDLVYSITGKELKFKNSRGYICSELVGLMCVRYFNLTFDKPLNLLKPVHIDKALLTYTNRGA